MANSTHSQVPDWIWLSLIPVFGGLVVAYAGHKYQKHPWLYVGLGTFMVAFVTASGSWSALVWLFQVAYAAYVKGLPIPMIGQSSYRARLREGSTTHLSQVDINTCSKDEMVRKLDLPIIYANNIDSMRLEGYVFTYIEELSEIAGLPEEQIRRIEPFVVFTYDYRKDGTASWRRINSLSSSELVEFGVERVIADKIVDERLQRGDYKSAIDIKTRTGLPVRAYEYLIK